MGDNKASLFETNVIAYVVREDYEIKTWIYAEHEETNEQLEVKARAKFKEAGVLITDNDTFDFENY